MRPLRILVVIAALAVVGNASTCLYGPLQLKFPDGYKLPVAAWTSHSEIARLVNDHDDIAKRSLSNREPDGPPIVFRGPEGLNFVMPPGLPTEVVEYDFRQVYPPDVASAIVQGKFAQGLGPDERLRLWLLMQGNSAKEVRKILDNTPEYAGRKAFADGLTKNEVARQQRLAERQPIVFTSVDERINEALGERARRAGLFCKLLLACGSP